MSISEHSTDLCSAVLRPPNGRFSSRPVHVHRVIPALSKELATVSLQVGNEVPALHFLRDRKQLSNRLFPTDALFRESSIRLQYQLDRFMKVRSSFLKGLPLRVGTGQFLNEGDVTLR